jgi:hypothetical protein
MVGGGGQASPNGTLQSTGQGDMLSSQSCLGLPTEAAGLAFAESDQMRASFKSGTPMIRAVTSAAILSLTIAAGGALAQAPSTSASPSATSAADKQAISKACSDQATAKGLHGKARKKFRSECKRRGAR